MTQNVLQIGPEALGIVFGVVVLFLFALAIAIPHRPRVLPGSSGHRDAADEAEHEEIRADGYIDSFSREIEEAGGGAPLVVKLAIPGILLWWLIYLIVNWAPNNLFH
ncbi:MAG: hypothetical protein KKA73_22430 [Chloroflexi bacterium]|nr:hypothetical protein [Chloroflexota bacterium]MBU1750451.1 hypothetical protein [Chloroflexota bacterium]